jgi:uncharacterized SAM-binding protein YcdF (DUF218 family)
MVARPRSASLAVAALALSSCASACGVPGRELFLPPQALEPADAIVVLGYRPPIDVAGNLTPEIERRLRRGVELYRRGLAPRMVVTGGPGPGGVVEADVMARYAEAHGVPAARILRDREARDTADNARRSVELLCAGRPLETCAPDVVVVSTPYHLRRALELFRCAGARAQPAPTELPDDVAYQVGLAAYEYGVRFVYVFDDACARARPRR